MRRLAGKDIIQIKNYIMREPEYNLFIIGDIENFGLDGKHVKAFVNETSQGWDCFLLQFFDSYILYSHHTDYDAGTVAQFLSDKDINVISGKGEIVQKLLPFLPHRHAVDSYLAKLTEIKANPALPQNAIVRRLNPDDAADMVALYLQTEGFRENYIGREQAAMEEIQHTLQKSGRSLGAYLNGKLSAIASTSAENPVSSMVVGVATLSGARGLGLASGLVALLCSQCLRDGKKFLCLFYNNPVAGNIYRKIGFTEMGKYMLIKRDLE